MENGDKTSHLALWETDEGFRDIKWLLRGPVQVQFEDIIFLGMLILFLGWIISILIEMLKCLLIC